MTIATINYNVSWICFDMYSLAFVTVWTSELWLLVIFVRVTGKGGVWDKRSLSSSAEWERGKKGKRTKGGSEMQMGIKVGWGRHGGRKSDERWWGYSKRLRLRAGSPMGIDSIQGTIHEWCLHNFGGFEPLVMVTHSYFMNVWMPLRYFQLVG